MAETVTADGFPSHLTSVPALPVENRPSKSCVEKNILKTSINFIYQDIWVPTADRLQSLITINQ